MSSHEYVRTDSETAEAVSRAMKILAEYGYIRARAYFKEAGIRADLTERMLLMRYDRRRSPSALADQVSQPEKIDKLQ